MSNVVSLEEKMKEKEEKKREDLLSQCRELKGHLNALLKEIIIPGAPEGVNSHPIPNKHWREGRFLYTNCPANQVEENLFKARSYGYDNLVVEDTAFKFKGPDAFIPIEGCVAIYAGRPKKS